MQLTFIGIFIISVSIPITFSAGLEAMFVFTVLCEPMERVCGSAARDVIDHADSLSAPAYRFTIVDVASSLSA